MKYAKTVMQLEKGLPPNSVVPILKEKVEGMRQKVLTPCLVIIFCLHNIHNILYNHTVVQGINSNNYYYHNYVLYLD